MNFNRYLKDVLYPAFPFVLLLSGCQRAPAFNVLGSYFPAWLFCLIVATLLTIVARIVLRRYNLGEVLNPPLLMYSCLTALFTFVLWLIFFRA
jgi:hypothetical protein